MSGPRLPAPDVAVPTEAPWLWYASVTAPRLAGMARPPAGFPFDLFGDAGFTDIVCLLDEVGDDPAPLRMHHHPLTDLVGGRLPANPAAEAASIAEAASLVRTLRRAGRSVVVHCGLGNGRTGTVIGAVLVAEGTDAPAVIRWLDAVQRRRGIASGWPESPWQSELLVSLAPRGDESAE
ncbi:protein-tyrosine phosphatase family protein [Microbacterium gorillae]|uniref:protein-tyrosine phosphatase family protein n=1 Tax=Microbacterium gorillae TaxID=1231063 RepID=UPI0006947089|nr:protein-tyrosine phosphatase family protein [Microbacterium gorillae]